MAGTAAGIAKANAARLARRQAREAATRQIRATVAASPILDHQPEVIPANEATSGNDNDSGGSLGVVGASLPVGEGAPSGNQTLAPEVIMSSLVPDAAVVVQKVLRGTLKVPASVRASTALRVVELHVGSAGKGAGESEEAATIAKLATALGMRAPRAPVTLDAEPIPPGPSSREPDPVS